ncbi:MAG: DUF484 family protein [Rhodobacteraceae bacterium]|nr:DUF484 family protein [Paracoccaceae bacterium]
MTEQAKPQDAVRRQILSDPNAVLDDRDIMRALIAADSDAKGSNVIDLRSIALERLEARLDRLEDTHRHVIAAAYDNLASTNQIHRAVLAILEPTNFAEFLRLLETELASILHVASAKLCLESPAVEAGLTPDLEREFGSGVAFFAPGEVQSYITRGRRMTLRPVTLRQIQSPDPRIFDTRGPIPQSEAMLKLDLGAGNLPAMLVLGSDITDQFTPQKGADLLVFFAGAFERVLRRWLS